VTNVKEVAEELESAYLHLDDNWRGVQGREKFLQMMILEGRRVPGANRVGNYAPNDPIFSRHGVLYMGHTA
jgi:hypothetical protein